MTYVCAYLLSLFSVRNDAKRAKLATLLREVSNERNESHVSTTVHLVDLIQASFSFFLVINCDEVETSEILAIGHADFA